MLLTTKYFSGDQIEKNGLGRSYGTYGGGGVHIGFWWGNLKEKTNVKT